jgi:catechol 2,3-dioxygenase-like lactoylglutathione lyase family enzyme
MDTPAFKPNRLAVVSLRAADLPAAVHFYRDVIGLPVLAHHAHRPAFELGNGCFLVMVQGESLVPNETSETPFPAIAFAVDDLDRAVEHLQANGVKLPWGIESNISERWVKFHDPSGNLIEFAQFE